MNNAGKLRYVMEDMFDIIPDKLGPNEKIIICHVVNDVGAWGAGFVIPLAKKFPKAEENYKEWTRIGKDAHSAIPFKQGHIRFAVIQNNIIICHMCAQTLGGERPLNYASLVECMSYVAIEARINQYKIVAPLFGSGLAGGNWSFIELLIQDIWLKARIDVDIYYLPQDKNKITKQIPKNFTL